MNEEDALAIALDVIDFFETGTARDGLFAPDVFCDFSPPLWRIQAQGAQEVVQLRLRSRPSQGRVTKWRVDPTPRGFVLELEEEWQHEGRDWYAHTILRAEVVGSSITSLAVFSTGDWTDERRAHHAREVRLLRR